MTRNKPITEGRVFKGGINNNSIDTSKKPKIDFSQRSYSKAVAGSSLSSKAGSYKVRSASSSKAGKHAN